MEFVGRSVELGRLRAALDQRRASVIRVTGIRGGGKTALVRRVLSDYGSLWHTAPPLPDPVQRREAMAALSAARLSQGRARHVETSEPTWSELLPGVLDLAPSGGRPFALVLDDAHRMSGARARHLDAIGATVRAARAEGRPLHVVLVGPEEALPDDDGVPPESPSLLRVGPLPFRSAAALLPGSRPHDLLRAYGVFGGIPRVLATLDPDVALGTNLRRLLLSPEAPLSDAGGTWIERDVQTPARYYAIVLALAWGEADWGTVHAGVPDLTRSGQVAPYLKRLEQLGLIVTRQSLDAAPRARSRRYALADPFLAMWARFVLAARAAQERIDGSDHYARLVSPALDDHISRIFPQVCRQHMALDALETLGENARESGSLWGDGYDIPVAGILGLGAAYYGTCLWQPPEADAGDLSALDRQIRETRYGFGRQGRLRIVFTGYDAPPWLQRQVARRHDATIIDAAGLAGDAR